MPILYRQLHLLKLKGYWINNLSHDNKAINETLVHLIVVIVKWQNAKCKVNNVFSSLASQVESNLI